MAHSRLPTYCPWSGHMGSGCPEGEDMGVYWNLWISDYNNSETFTTTSKLRILVLEATLK